MQTAAKTALPDPIIERRPSIRIAGLMGRHDMSNASSIPAQWQSFRPYLGNVAHQVPNGGAYGVVGDADESSFDYLCGVEVTSDAGLPPELTLVRVPEQRYARFRHEGHISTIRATIGAIFSDWLPRSGEEQSEQCGMVEYYGPDFDGRTGLGTTEIWLGLKG